MNTFTTLAVILAVAVAASANQADSLKADLAARHNDALAARINLGTAFSLIVPVALGIALVGFLAPLFQSMFSPIAFGPTIGYARKGKSLFSGISQEHVMQVFETVTKALDAFAEVDKDKAQPKAQ